ncbi:unnamed protein product [Moneuplotes crassus]|uniref:Uncharacterized protein n=1 Tax=Euplotes crassus TaxID=5936 RepID=A0AAD1UJA8_EUPCR|nr:unnamed protein product [Moneuplotes crassus]
MGSACCATSERRIEIEESNRKGMKGKNSLDDENVKNLDSEDDSILQDFKKTMAVRKEIQETSIQEYVKLNKDSRNQWSNSSSLRSSLKKRTGKKKVQVRNFRKPMINVEFEVSSESEGSQKSFSIADMKMRKSQTQVKPDFSVDKSGYSTQRVIPSKFTPKSSNMQQEGRKSLIFEESVKYKAILMQYEGEDSSEAIATYLNDKKSTSYLKIEKTNSNTSRVVNLADICHERSSDNESDPAYVSPQYDHEQEY